jgi:TRAP-type C4-dicarboxylate transport system permease small subunit
MVKKILDKVEMVLRVLCGVFMAVIVAVLSYAVIMRYVFHLPPAWSMEFSRYLFLWMVMLSAVIVTREESHIQITFILNLLPGKVRFVWLTVLRILMIGFCWIMIQQGLTIYPTVSEASSPSLGISMGWMYLSVPASGVLMGIYILESMLASFVDRVKVASSSEKLTC